MQVLTTKEDLMKRLLVLVTVVLLVLSPVAGCGGEITTYTDAGHTIDIGLGKEFIIALGSNPTTGYKWEAHNPDNMILIIEDTYQPGNEEGVVGAGGVEYFRFKAVKKGSTEIIMTYKRAWEEESLDQKVFTINIK